MGGADAVDRMMSVRTKKRPPRMLMHVTDLALANSWLLYRKDLAQTVWSEGINVQ